MYTCHAVHPMPRQANHVRFRIKQAAQKYTLKLL